jgi:hypothetical protein
MLLYWEFIVTENASDLTESVRYLNRVRADMSRDNFDVIKTSLDSIVYYLKRNSIVLR